jgi:hypothetical protein
MVTASAMRLVGLEHFVIELREEDAPFLERGISLDYRRCRARRRDRIRVSMNKLPNALLQPKQACHAHRNWDEFVAAPDLASSGFHLDNTRELVGGA